MAEHPDRLFPCYVLHRRDFGNTSLVVELFAQELGRIPALAKGAKQPRTPGAALLQPFRPLLIALSGRGEMRTLRRLEPGATVPPLLGRALYCGFYVNELVVRLLGRGDPHERLFEYYGGTLGALAVDGDQAAILRRFELRLLEEIGYALVLNRDVTSGEPLRPSARYRYDPERGPIGCGDQDPPGSIAGSTLLALAGDGDLEAAAAREARDLMRRVLSHHLGGKPLKSRELFGRPSGLDSTQPRTDPP